MDLNDETIVEMDKMEYDLLIKKEAKKHKMSEKKLIHFCETQDEKRKRLILERFHKKLNKNKFDI